MRLLSLLIALLILFLTIVLCHAAGPAATPPGSGKKKLMLFAKEPATWSIVKNSGRGKLVYREATGAFNLTATGLQPRAGYALIRYADTPPKAEILARGVSDQRGNLQLNGVWGNWTKKFWLVSGDDVGGAPGETGTMYDWRPRKYLFEEKPLGIPCNCPEPEEP